MKLWNKPSKRHISIPPRIQSMTTQELTNWMETSIMGLGASFDNWRYHQGFDKPVTEHIEVITAMWEELQVRRSFDKVD